MAFCPKCKKLALPKDGKLVCRNPACGFVSEAATASRVVRSEAEGHVRVIREETEEVRPQQAVTCPKCGNDKAYFHLMQTRRSDEPPTQINECTKCKHSWRDYQ